MKQREQGVCTNKHLKELLSLIVSFAFLNLNFVGKPRDGLFEFAQQWNMSDADMYNLCLFIDVILREELTAANTASFENTTSTTLANFN